MPNKHNYCTTLETRLLRVCLQVGQSAFFSFFPSFSLLFCSVTSNPPVSLGTKNLVSTSTWDRHICCYGPRTNHSFICVCADVQRKKGCISFPQSTRRGFSCYVSGWLVGFSVDFRIVAQPDTITSVVVDFVPVAVLFSGNGHVGDDVVSKSERERARPLGLKALDGPADRRSVGPSVRPSVRPAAARSPAGSPSRSVAANCRPKTLSLA